MSIAFRDLPPLPRDEPKGRIGSWAPGRYACKCLTCEKPFWGDKRALSCLPCAQARADASQT